MLHAMSKFDSFAYFQGYFLCPRGWGEPTVGLAIPPQPSLPQHTSSTVSSAGKCRSQGQKILRSLLSPLLPVNRSEAPVTSQAPFGNPSPVTCSAIAHQRLCAIPPSQALKPAFPAVLSLAVFKFLSKAIKHLLTHFNRCLRAPAFRCTRQRRFNTKQCNSPFSQPPFNS